MFDFDVTITPKKTPGDENKVWDFIVIGGGPAGINASLYAKRKGLETLIISKEMGGQLHNTTDVDNYLGYTRIEGKHLSKHFVDHLSSLEVPIYQDVVVESIIKENKVFAVSLSDETNLKAKTLLVATGGAPRKLNIPGEKEFTNKGVSYCTTCDAPFFKDKHVVVAGGGNSAAEAVLDLSYWAKKVTVIHRSQWRADKILLDQIHQKDNVSIHLETQLLEVIGKNVMTQVRAFDKVNSKEFYLDADGLFIEIGTIPNNYLLKDLVELNEQGEVLVDTNQMTSLEGLYAAGDLTMQPYKQIIISAAEGAKAALAATHYIHKKKNKENHNGKTI